MKIDHVIYGTVDLDAAAARVEADLGLSAIAGGHHDGVGTHNRIVPLGDGTFIELLAIADPKQATASALGSALQAAIERGEGLLGWAVAVEDVKPVAERLGTSISTVGRQGSTARLTGVVESLAERYLPFFIERGPGRLAGARANSAQAPSTTPGASAISWIEVGGDASRLERWTGGAQLPVRIVGGEPGVRALAVGERELRSSSGRPDLQISRG